jgi:uncharacterized membrane protein YdjX (TVP38/TMEM64 family)
LPSIKVWQYLWTAAVAIIPYFVGIAFMFEGISSGSFKWVVVGIIIELVCISSGYYITKKNKKDIDKKN